MTHQSNFPENYPLTTEAQKKIWRAVAEEARSKHSLLTLEQLAYAESRAQVCRDLMAGMPPIEVQIMDELKRSYNPEKLK